MKVQNNLQQIMKEKDIRVWHLSWKCKVSESTIENIIYNRHNPSMETVLRMAKYLKLKVEDMFSIEEF